MNPDTQGSLQQIKSTSKKNFNNGKPYGTNVTDINCINFFYLIYRG
jgi:hypothetical protein